MVDKSVCMAQGLYLTCNLIYFKLRLRLLRVLKKTQGMNWKRSLKCGNCVETSR